ncbi:hypothetical protein MMC13_006489 [Lambiella insularis]|nr:hypothetical protein [Lambiella insularis]
MRSIPHTKDNPKCYSLRNSDPDNSKFEMQNVGNDLYELIIHKGFGLAAELWSDGNGEPYRTNDLFLEEPPASGNFVLQGRRDDVLVHTDGNNTSAGALQLVIQAKIPVIKNVLAVGHSRPCVALLVELKLESGVAYDEVFEGVWTGVQEVNKNHPRYSQVLRSMIYLLPQGEPLPVTPKGNVKRNEAISRYKDAIDKMYRELEGEDNLPNGGKLHNHDSASDLIRRCVSTILQTPPTSLKDTTSFYGIGMDSLSALQIRQNLSKAMGQKITIGTIFENPSIAQLTAYFHGTKSMTEGANHTSFVSRTVARCISQFSCWSRPLPVAFEHSGSETILLTGASGSLGSALLEILLAASKVSKVYALIRGPNGLSKLKTSLELRNLDKDIIENGKLKVLNYSMQDPLLGLDIDSYHQLSKEVTTVIHCAWNVNFYQTVEGFEDDCLNGTMALLRFCCAGMYKRFAFTSSVSTCMGSGVWGKEVPEEPVRDDPTVALGTGYAQSKFIAERIIQAASEQLGIICVILRVGGLTGHTKGGHWSEQDMYPIMFSTAFRLNALPTFENRMVDWLPVDVAAATITDILALLSRHDDNYCNLFNIVHPHPVPWSRLLELLQECQVSSGRAKLAEIPILEWTKRLAEAEERMGQDAKALPGLKVLQFFDEMALENKPSATFSTAKAVEVSRTLRDCPPLAFECFESYVRQWRHSGFLPQ